MRLPLIALVVAAFSTGLWAASATDLGVASDGKTDVTAAIQALLDAGHSELHFPAGQYLIGTLTVPANVTLSFAPDATIIVNPAAIADTEAVQINGDGRQMKRRRSLLRVTGDHVRIEGLRFDFASGGTQRDPTPTEVLIDATNATDVVVRGVHVITSQTPPRRDSRILFNALDCRDVVLENSSARDISHMIWTVQCANVTVRGNNMIGGASMTTFAFGSENLRHHDNWSRQVDFQCVWRGGSPDPSRKAPRVPLGTANVVHRGSRPDDPDFVPHTQGVFDVLVQNNYAEYGTVLCWGNKGRQIIVDGNIARFMWDYAYGSEGGENVVFSNNISINSAVAGFMSMYWGEKLLITGNLVVVRHEPMNGEYTQRPESAYFGQFVRLHHGPPNPEDNYGQGTVQITGNLFINELANRPSGISIEGGRDVLVNGNKIVNGLLRKHDEITRVRVSPEGRSAADGNEFESQEAPTTQPADVTYRLERRARADLSRVTVMNNEFISRQPTDKAVIIVNGSTASAIVKDNVFRREQPTATYTDAQRRLEQSPPRYMLYAVDDFENRDLTNSTIASAIRIATDTPVFSLVQGNFIYGWRTAIEAINASDRGDSSFIVTGNTVDGRIAVDGPAERTVQKTEANIELPPGLRAASRGVGEGENGDQ